MKEKKNRGITLIALIITIIVLLILAVVAISAVSGNGILNHASNARNKYSDAQKNEQKTLQGYLGYLDESQLASKKVKDNLNKVLSTSGNLTLEDDFGNKIKVPAGFKILVDDTTGYTADDIDVTKGIVVEDTQAETAGNQFVWIPVGKIYTDKEKTEENAKTITLGRYVFKSDGTIDEELSQSAPEGQLKHNSSASVYFIEGKKNEATTNAHAKDIEAFVSKTNASGGYYIGRYEARVENYDASNISTKNSSSSEDWTGYVAESEKELKLVSKAKSQVWNRVTQKKASNLCQSMYTDKPYESDLVNGYAWDTVIVFIQEFENSTYSQTKGKATDSKLSNTGLSILKETSAVDKQCNIYDMAGNCYEWSTETNNVSNSPCLGRGGNYNSSTSSPSSRNITSSASSAIAMISFRPVLYM